jgi:D-amino-acid oxidase
VTPVRGQVMTVEPCGLTDWLLADRTPEELTYVIPRENDVVVGGTKQSGDWNLAVDPETTKRILARASELVPQLRRAKIIRQRVGLRPARPTIRCELVRTRTGEPVIHCYGHGGSGVTLSWGCANEVFELVQNL